MTILMTSGEEHNDWDGAIPNIQRVINNSERKVTTKTPFKLLHGYQPRFHLENLHDITKISEEWIDPAKLRDKARELIEQVKGQMKEASQLHQIPGR